MSARPHGIRAFGIAIAGGLFFATSVSAVVFNVDSVLDEVDDDLVNITCHTAVGGPAAGKCTLRAAVMQANVMPSDSTIVLPAGTYVLERIPSGAEGDPSTGDLDLMSGAPIITIAGAGAAITIIDANDLDRVNVNQSTISSNSAEFGGGVYNNNTLYLTNSTISGNTATGDGGGVYNEGTFWTYDATIVFNQADSDADKTGGSGGGVYNGSVFNPRNSLLAGNTHGLSPDLDDCAGTVGVFGQDWFSTYAGCNPVAQTGTAEFQLIGSLAELGPLQFNGGSTRTHALAASSPIIDSGIACQEAFGPLLVDQRGGARNIEASCEPGAFEYDALPAGLLFADGFELGNFFLWG